MSAVRLQTELKEAFDVPETPTLSVIADSPPLPAPVGARREIDEILIRHGRLGPDAAQRIRERSARTKEDFSIAARRLNLATSSDLEIARAIRDGVLRDEPSAFDLGAELVILRRPNSVAAEQYRALRARLLTTQPAEKLRSVSIIPAGAAAPAEVAAANVAIALAQLGKRVLLIDGDLRRPSLANLLAARRPNAEEDPASADLSFEFSQTPVAGLVLLAGQAPSLRSQEFLASARFAAMLACARTEYDIVLALTSPFGPAADGQFVWAQTKAALIAARRDHTRTDDLKALHAAVRQVGSEILGAIILD